MELGKKGRDGTLAGRQLRLLLARGELAEARIDRMLRSCALGAEMARQASPGAFLLDRHAWRTGSLLDVEQMLQSDLPAEVDLGTTFEHFATHLLIGSDRLTELRTSFGRVLVSGEVCRWVMLIANELLHVVESSNDGNEGCTAHVVIDHREDGLVMTVIGIGGAERPVPSRSGAAALTRVTKVMGLLGRLSKSVHAGDVVYEANFSGGRVSAGS